MGVFLYIELCFCLQTKTMPIYFTSALIRNKYRMISDIRTAVKKNYFVVHTSTYYMHASIVIIRNWLGNPANFKETNKDHKFYVGRPTTLHNLLFCAHTLWLNYVTVTFLLVSSSGTNHDLLCLCRVKAKKANKNIEQKIFPSFLTIYFY